jgi:potassium efflux system protein
VTGVVSRVRIRATTITNWDRKEFVVPNKEFITGKVLNWTLSDAVTRVTVPIGLAYGSDTALAERLLLEAARENPNVLTDPAPRAIFSAFGDSTLDFRLYVFIPRRSVYGEMLHRLTTTIDRKFRQAGLNIAFPQRDLHLSTDRPLAVQLVPPAPDRPTPSGGRDFGPPGP